MGAVCRDDDRVRRRDPRVERRGTSRHRVHAGHGVLGALQHLRAQCPDAGRQDAASAGARDGAQGRGAVPLRRDARRSAARRPRVAQSGGAKRGGAERRASALRNVLSRVPRGARQGRRSTRPADSESARLHLATSERDGAGTDLSRHQPRIGTDAVVCRADSVRAALARRAVRERAARRQGAAAVTSSARTVSTPSLRVSALALVSLAAVTVLAGLAWSPARTWPNLLLANVYLLSIALSGALFISIHYLSG